MLLALWEPQSGIFRRGMQCWGCASIRKYQKEIPITILFGDTDNTLPAQFSQERSLVPAHSRWVVLPESGHAPMWDRPAEVIAEVLHTCARV
jgi:pimeloyl-ACP methyl ester carboxylesterase